MAANYNYDHGASSDRGDKGSQMGLESFLRGADGETKRAMEWAFRAGVVAGSTNGKDGMAKQ